MRISDWSADVCASDLSWCRVRSARWGRSRRATASKLGSPASAGSARHSPGSSEMTMTKAAIIGSGNIGTDLMVKLLRGGRLELVAMAGIDPGSDGLERARRLGVATTHEGLDGLRTMPGYGGVGTVFAATSSAPPPRHPPGLAADGKRA